MASSIRPQTRPGQSLALLVPDTEPFVLQTSQQDYCSGKLQQGCDAVLQDLGSLLEAPFDHILQKLLPYDPSGLHIDGILHGLKMQDMIDGDRWKSVLWSPSSSPNIEETFTPLSEIINGILHLIPNVALSYVNNPRCAPVSEGKSSSILDGFLKLSKTKTVQPSKSIDETHWFDIAVPFEFKKKTQDRGKNERQIIWNLHCIMREDPCRRFAFGITIENEDLRVWFTNHAYLAVTKCINFCTGFRHVISLFHSLGPASNVQLGWDPTIERVPVGMRNQYRVVVNKMVFTTQEELATCGADSMIGRGTRVWKAMDEGDVVVVKDGWRDPGRPPEGEILELVLGAIKTKIPDEFDEARKRFVSIREFGDVRISDGPDETRNLNDDFVQDVLPAGYKCVKLTAEILSVSTSRSAKTHTLSLGDIPYSYNPLKRPIPRRVHHRTIPNDIGITIQDMNNPRDTSVVCLTCVLINLHAPLSRYRMLTCGLGLYYMHLIGWVHRDISIGNGLWVSVGGDSIGKLMDLEYAKSVDSDVSHNVRTGTVNFMACEVLVMEYASRSKADTLPSKAKFTGDVEEVPFRMNFLHDLESVFWSFTWVLYRHADTDNQTSNTNRRLRKFQNLFPGTTIDRLLFLQNKVRDARNVLANDSGAVALCLADIAHWFVEGFTTVEKSYPRINAKDDFIIENTHGDIRSAFSDALQSIRDIRLISVSEISNKTGLGEDEQSSPTQKKMRPR